MVRFSTAFLPLSDGLLCNVAVTYARGGTRAVTIIVSARDQLSGEDDEWSQVRLVVERVDDYCLADEERTTQQVLSNGLHLVWAGDRVGVDISQFVDPPDTLEELRTSRFFAIGAELTWEVGKERRAATLATTPGPEGG